MQLTRRDTGVIDLMLPSQLGYEKLVWQLLGWLAAGLPLAAGRIADLQTAVCEACINAIEHGNQLARSRRVHLRLIIARQYVEVEVRDEGVVQLPAEQPRPASITEKMADLAPPRGMGLLLMQQLVDECELVTDGPGTGNRCRLRIYV